ncbi:MAG: hypothetical protein B7C24_17455 [Bacteroidetes bacterium 4572_77]|nr:MAG: hypothetical protein B7C24_17455 [Bacteroidetes bacterium 4572_77]
MQNENTVILNVLGKDSTILPYRRELAMIAGSTNAAILLNQLLYWYEKMGRKPFFKYKEPPQRKENETDDQYYERVYPYKNGDSWTEELYFTKREFDDALHLIAHNKNNPKMYRDGKRISKREEQAIENGETLYPIKKFIRFWTTRDRLTYYEINDMVGLGKVLSIFFLNNNLQFRKGTKDTLDIIQRILTETTTIHSKECICASERSAGEDGKLNSNDKSLNIQNTTKPTKINKLSKSLDPSNKPLTNSETLRTKSKTFKSKSKPKKEYAPCPEKYEPYLDAWEQYTGRTFQGMNGVYTKGWKTIRKVTLGTFFSKTNTPTIDSRFFG